MNLNVTLLGELITFMVLVWVTMKFIWPPMLKALQDREKKIADGLEAAERGQKNLELAQAKIKTQLQAAKTDASDILEQANLRSAQLIEAAKETAITEAKKIHDLAKSDVAKEVETARLDLQKQVADLVIKATEKVLQQNIDVAANRKLINKVIEEI